MFSIVLYAKYDNLYKMKSFLFSRATRRTCCIASEIMSSEINATNQSSQYSAVYVTTPNEDVAKKIAHGLVLLFFNYYFRKGGLALYLGGRFFCRLRHPSFFLYIDVVSEKLPDLTPQLGSM